MQFCADVESGLTAQTCWGCTDPTCFHLAVQCSRTIEDQALDLEEFIGLVPTNHCEAKAPTAFPQLCVNELAFQFRRVSCKKGFAWIKQVQTTEPWVKSWIKGDLRPHSSNSLSSQGWGLWAQRCLAEVVGTSACHCKVQKKPEGRTELASLGNILLWFRFI